MMIQMLRQKGAGYSDEDGNILIFNDTTEEMLETVAYNTAAGAFSTFKISSYPANFLNAGQCIFAIDSTAGATWMGSDAPNLDVKENEVVEFETVVMAIPQFDTESPKMISQGPSICVFNKEDPAQVLASWLFAQFLLTDRVQIDYSKTEGYVPVTERAQQSAEYLDYLASAGRESSKEDAWIYHQVKHDAVRLLLDNIDNTFVTPVFNGSTSLRNAAGHLIEDVALSARRGENIDGAYMKTLYKEAASLYKLDQLTASGAQQSLGALPPSSVALIVTLGVVWLGITLYAALPLVKKTKLWKKMSNKS
jgi:multiple sugar transport system substrate-binding protein